METWAIGAVLVVVECSYVWLWSRHTFRHPVSDTMLMAAGGVLLVVAAFAARQMAGLLQDPANLLIWYVIVGGAPALGWALGRREQDTTAALESATDALKGK